MLNAEWPAVVTLLQPGKCTRQTPDTLLTVIQLDHRIPFVLDTC